MFTKHRFAKSTKLTRWYIIFSVYVYFFNGLIEWMIVWMISKYKKHRKINKVKSIFFYLVEDLSNFFIYNFNIYSKNLIFC